MADPQQFAKRLVDPADCIRVLPLGAKVGNVANEGPELLEPVAAAGA